MNPALSHGDSVGRPRGESDLGVRLLGGHRHSGTEPGQALGLGMLQERGYR